jgi:hypothetical protein
MVLFFRLSIAPSRRVATGANPMVETTIPKMVPEMKFNIVNYSLIIEHPTEDWNPPVPVWKVSY